MLKATCVFAAALFTAAPALPCTVIAIATPRELVSRAETIVRARADASFANPTYDKMQLDGSPTRIRFTVLQVLKGSLAANEITINGHFQNRDDRNDRPVPYDFIRPGGRGGNCFALGYRQGAEYLLFLSTPPATDRAPGQPAEPTPYWGALAPTNEQLFGDDDPWLRWVSAELARSK